MIADGTGPVSRLVVGFDGSPPAARAARLAIDLSRGGRAQVWLVYAHRPDPRLAEPRTEEEVRSPAVATERAMELLVREGRSRGVEVLPVLRDGDPATVVLAVSREVGAGMIMVGTRGLGAAARVLLGAVSSRIVSASTVPVTVVP
ncbi:MAG TPA: universal stress protein [Thermoplasmata archaeon]|nr:universal stress protein [Thermoplasmata archaeon]